MYKKLHAAYASIAVSIFLAACTNAAERKTDILGVKTGMTLSQAEAILNATCKRPPLGEDYEFVCHSQKFSEGEFVYFQTTRFLPQAIVLLNMNFIASDDTNAVYKEVSSQYHVEIQKDCSGFYRTPLADGLDIQLVCQGGLGGRGTYSLNIRNTALMKADEQAAADAAHKAAPAVPKL